MKAAVGSLWKGKLGADKGEGESQASHFQASPWHVAPLHLPLVGQNCWPHMANGFSASFWIRPVKNNGDERLTHGGKEERSTAVFI